MLVLQSVKNKAPKQTKGMVTEKRMLVFFDLAYFSSPVFLQGYYYKSFSKFSLLNE